MTSETAITIAQHINEDRDGANYYCQTDELINYLMNAMNMSEADARMAKEHICDDRNGSDYYKDTNLLAEYLSGFETVGQE